MTKADTGEVYFGSFRPNLCEVSVQAKSIGTLTVWLS